MPRGVGLLGGSTVTAPWLWVEDLTVEPGDEVMVEGAEAAHLSGPLRRRPGAPVTLFDGAGTVVGGRVAEAASRRIQIVVESVDRVPCPVGDGVIVGLSLLHTQAMDWAVQKLVEVGARLFVPVVAERSQLGHRQAVARLERWRRMVRQASKQCRRPWLMEVGEPKSLSELVATWGEGGGLVGAAEGRPLQELASSLPNRLLVGPEGGLSAAETDLVAARGLVPVVFGPHVLRAETAAVVGAAFLVARGCAW